MTVSEKSIGQPNPNKPTHTLATLEARWKESKSDQTFLSDFYGVVCEAIGTDPGAYRRLTEDMIAERARQHPHWTDKQVALDVLDNFESNFKFLKLLLKNDPERLSRVLAAKGVWLEVAEAMRQEWEAK